MYRGPAIYCVQNPIAVGPGLPIAYQVDLPGGAEYLEFYPGQAVLNNSADSSGQMSLRLYTGICGPSNSWSQQGAYFPKSGPLLSLRMQDGQKTIPWTASLQFLIEVVSNTVAIQSPSMIEFSFQPWSSDRYVWSP